MIKHKKKTTTRTKKQPGKIKIKTEREEEGEKVSLFVSKLGQADMDVTGAPIPGGREEGVGRQHSLEGKRCLLSLTQGGTK